MRIIWFAWKDREHPDSGGAEVVTDELARRLVQDGHHVTLLTAGFPGATPEAQRHGYHIIRVGGRYTSYLEAWLYYRKHLRGQADLVVDECNTMPFFAAWYSGTRTVLFFHMLCREIWFYQFPFPLSLIGYLAEPIYLRLLKPTPIITVSESTKRDLTKQGLFKARNIRIIPEAITLPPVRSLAAITKAKHPTLLSFGSIRPMKRTLDQVKAFELARDSHPSLRLVVAGDATGAYGEKVLSYIKASRHAPAITYAGRTSEAEKLQLMRQSTLLLATSVKEGWGLTVTEAASQGTPAVVYNVDGLRDSVRHDQTGLIARTNTPEGLAASIKQLLSDTSSYARYQRAGWTWARQLTFNHSYQEFKRKIDLGA